MNCPNCKFYFGAIAANASEIPDLCPGVCERCSKVFLLERGVPRSISDEELAEIKKSPAWDFLSRALDAIEVVKRAKKALLN